MAIVDALHVKNEMKNGPDGHGGRGYFSFGNGLLDIVMIMSDIERTSQTLPSLFASAQRVVVAVRDDEEKSCGCHRQTGANTKPKRVCLFRGYQPPAQLCPSKCRESCLSVDFTPQPAHATLHMSSKGAHGPHPPPATAASPPADPAAVSRFGQLIRCDVPAPRNPNATHNP